FFSEYEFHPGLLYVIELAGHPFSALIIANLVAWYFLGVRRGMRKEHLLKISSKSLEAAGIIILLTGAGGAFKQILIDTGAGEMIAAGLNSSYFNPLIFGFLVAAIVRILRSEERRVGKECRCWWWWDDEKE